jgi:hypothetical protein
MHMVYREPVRKTGAEAHRFLGFAAMAARRRARKLSAVEKRSGLKQRLEFVVLRLGIAIAQFD